MQLYGKIAYIQKLYIDFGENESIADVETHKRISLTKRSVLGDESFIAERKICKKRSKGY